MNEGIQKQYRMCVCEKETDKNMKRHGGEIVEAEFKYLGLSEATLSAQEW